MKLRPIAEDSEAIRISNLDAMELMAVDGGAEFNALVSTVAALLSVPTAAISILDDERQWLKAAHGIATQSTPRELALCANVVDQNRPLVVEDAMSDPRFAAHPMVIGAPFLRFYAGAPLRMSSGNVFGTLCVIDFQPRTLAPVQLEALIALARQVVQLLELRALNAKLREQNVRIRDGQTKLLRAYAMMKASPNFLAVTDGGGQLIDLHIPASFASVPAANTLIGKRVTEVGADLPDEFLPAIGKVLQDGTSRTLSYSFQLKDRRLSFQSELIKLSDDEVLIVGRDVTSSVEVEKLKNEFISMIAHEIRTPLSAIHGSLAILDSQLLGELGTEQLEMVHISMQSAERLSRLVNDVLDLERLSQGKLELTLQPNDPCELIQSAAREVLVLAEQVEITLKLELEPGFRVTCDRDRIVQALVNLLGNAIRFSPSGTVVTARVDATDQDRVRLSVRDSGPGIDQATQARLFRRFERGAMPATHGGASTGLGLAIVKNILEQHGGSVGVDSTPGEGATFYLELAGTTPPVSQLRARWEREAMEELRQDVRRAIAQSTAELSATLLALQKESATSKQLQSAQRIAHRLSGSAPMAGFAAVGSSASELEEHLRALPVQEHCKPSAELLLAFEQFIACAQAC